MSLLDCKHRNRQLVSAMSSVGNERPDQSHHVYICLDCGEFTVHTRVGGVHATVSFALATEASVAAAGKWLEELKDEDSK